MQGAAATSSRARQRLRQKLARRIKFERKRRDWRNRSGLLDAKTQLFWPGPALRALDYWPERRARANSAPPPRGLDLQSRKPVQASRSCNSPNPCSSTPPTKYPTIFSTPMWVIGGHRQVYEVTTKPPACRQCIVFQRSKRGDEGEPCDRVIHGRIASNGGGGSLARTGLWWWLAAIVVI